MKKAITAVLLFMLLASSFSVFAIPKTKADVQDVQVMSYSYYTIPGYDISTGDFIVVGEVQNLGSHVVDPVVVNCVVLTSDNVPRASGVNTVFARYLAPGQKAPFYIDITANDSYSGELGWDQLSDLQLGVFVSQANNTDTHQYSNFSIIGEYSSVLDGVYTVKGDIKNTGDQTSDTFRLVTTFYNENGTVAAVNVTDTLGSTLAPGQSVPFTVTPADHTRIAGTVSSHSLLVQTDGPLTGPATPTSPPPSTPAVTQSASPEASPTSQPNQNSTSPVLYVVIAAVIAAAVVMVALLVLQKRRKPAVSEQATSPQQQVS